MTRLHEFTDKSLALPRAHTSVITLVFSNMRVHYLVRLFFNQAVKASPWFTGFSSFHEFDCLLSVCPDTSH